MAVPDHPRPAVSTRRGNILMVDDCPTTRAWMSAALEARGWRVLALADGAAALAVARVLRFDAIVLDVEMPGLDGLALGRALRQEPGTAHARIVMHSGLDEAEVRAGFSGYDAFVPKSGHPQLLGERLEQLLRASEEASAL
ncbi:MAG TPA: response regulator [Aquabacterium sp.]|nr:response regulator [Aquabacterium sp.]HQC94149.1 response regulator [Aquabacterium sp.]